MPSTSPSPAILIVGAGPTGLTLAHELLRRGITPRLVEKAALASPNTKALGVMARTLELLAPAGIAAEMLTQGVRVPAFTIWSAGRRVAHLDFAGDLESAYPFILMLPQHTTEAILAEHVARRGGRVERGTALVGLTQRGESVEAVLRHADGSEERTSASYLVGCDGAHSTVRRLLGAPFVGTTVAQRFVTGDVRMRWTLPHDQAVAYLNHGHFIAYFPLPDGQHRILSASPPDEAPVGEVTPDEIQRVIDACGPAGARATEPSWLARYRVQRRTVARYVHRRVLLAGDAAHVHSPLGAQGMNTGMQDAINLGWKLALVAQGRASDRLLESYHSERAEVGARMLREDALLARVAFLRHPLATARDRVAPHLMQHPWTQRFVTQTAAGLRIAYHRGPLAFASSEEPRSARTAGARVGSRAPNGLLLPSRHGSPSQLYELLTGTGHALLLFTAQRDVDHRREVRVALAEWQDLLDVYPIRRLDPVEDADASWYDPVGALARRYGIADEGLVLIRPDGYIGFVGQSLAAEPLRRYLRAHFSLPRAMMR